MDLFELVGNIAIKNSDAIKALDDTSAQGVKTESKLTKTFSGIGKAALGVGKVMGTAMLAGATAVGTLAVKAMNLGGELEQNMGGSEQVFGEFADKMQGKAKEAFSNMGLSTSDYLATANKMGALFQGAGFSIEESMNLSSDAMQRAADVASIMGLDTSSAMEAVAGAAKGNFTMMDNLGVAMNETSLAAYALEKGYEKTYDQMSQQEKIGVAMEMFLDKTAYATGNYAKENETLAGALGTAKAALTNFLDGSGDVDSLVKAFENAANVIVGNLQGLLPRLVTGLISLVNQIVPLIAPLLQKLLPAVIEGAKSLLEGVAGALPAVLDTIISALPSLIIGIKSIFGILVGETIPTLIESLMSALPSLLVLLVDALASMIVMLCGALPQVLQPIIDNLPTILMSIVNALLQNLPILIDGLLQLIAAIVAMLPDLLIPIIQCIDPIVFGLLEALWKSLPAIWDGIVALMQSLWNLIVKWTMACFENYAKIWNFFVDFLEPVWDAVCNVVKIGVQLIASILKTAFQIITLPFRFIWENCKEYVFAAWEWIKEKVSAAINAVKSVITKVMDGIKKYFTTVLNIYKKIFTTAWNAIKNVVSTVVNAVKNRISTAFNAIKSVVSSVSNAVKSVASKAWNGIKDAMTKPIEKARDLIKGIVDKIKGFFTGMNLSFPKIKLPHFSIKPKGWKIGDLLEGKIPKLGIDFYAKGGIMTEPTLFNYNPATGRASVGGEAGDEAIAPIDTLRQYIREEVRAENSGIVQRLERIIELLVQFFPEMLEALDISLFVGDRELAVALASPMNDELGKIAIRKGRGR